MSRYPGAIWFPSHISHDRRSETRGIVIHWTAGHHDGDLSTLDGPDVDVQFYVDKAGRVYQLLDSDSQAWHAFHTANSTCVGIEHEGSGEAWTPKQLAASARLCGWLCRKYRIPIRHVDPRSSSAGPSWRGLFGHRDLAGIDGNDHNDSVPADTGWHTFIAAVKRNGKKPLPLWQVLVRGKVVWHKRVKRPPQWAKDVARRRLDVRLRRIK